MINKVPWRLAMQDRSWWQDALQLKKLLAGQRLHGTTGPWWHCRWPPNFLNPCPRQFQTPSNSPHWFRTRNLLPSSEEGWWFLSISRCGRTELSDAMQRRGWFRVTRVFMFSTLWRTSEVCLPLVPSLVPQVFQRAGRPEEVHPPCSLRSWAGRTVRMHEVTFRALSTRRVATCRATSCRGCVDVNHSFSQLSSWKSWPAGMREGHEIYLYWVNRIVVSHRRETAESLRTPPSQASEQCATTARRVEPQSHSRTHQTAGSKGSLPSSQIFYTRQCHVLCPLDNFMMVYLSKHLSMSSDSTLHLAGIRCSLKLHT